MQIKRLWERAWCGLLTVQSFFCSGKKCEELGVEVNQANKALLKSTSDGKTEDDDAKPYQEEEDDDDEPYQEEEGDDDDDDAKPYQEKAKKVVVDPSNQPERSFLLSEKAAGAWTSETKPTMETPQKTATKKEDWLKSPPISTPPKTKSSPFLSPSLFQKLSLGGSDNDSAAPSVIATEEDSGATSSQTSSTTEDGSRQYPYLTFIDLEHPERSRDFDAHFVVAMSRLGWERPGIHVRKMINSFDMELWSAEIPKPGEFPKYEGRCMLVRRPAFDFIQRKPNLYHSKKLAKDDVKKAHQNYIRQGDIQDWVFHLLYVNDGIELDNSHFAGEVTSIVETGFNPVKLASGHDDNEFNQDVRMLYVFWEIAYKHGGLKLGDPDERKVDKKKLFD